MRYKCNMSIDDYKTVVSVVKPWYIPYGKMLFDIFRAGFLSEPNLVVENLGRNMLLLTMYHKKEYMDMEDDPYIGEYDNGEEFK